MVLAVAGRERQAEQPALAGVAVDPGNPHHVLRVAALLGDPRDPAAGPLADERVPAGQEGDRPRHVEPVGEDLDVRPLLAGAAGGRRQGCQAQDHGQGDETDRPHRSQDSGSDAAAAPVPTSDLGSPRVARPVPPALHPVAVDPSDRGRAGRVRRRDRATVLARSPIRRPLLPGPRGAARGGPLHRRRRLQRPLGGPAREAPGSGPPGRAGRGRADRLGCERSQRRLPLGVDHARARERPEPLPGRDADPRAARDGELRRAQGRPRPPPDRVRLRGDRRARGRGRRPPGRGAAGGSGAAPRLRPRHRGARAGAAARRNRLADLSGGGLGSDRRGARRPGQALRRARASDHASSASRCSRRRRSARCRTAARRSS